MSKTTNTDTPAAQLKAVCAMPQEKLDAKADELLTEASAAVLALQAMREARKTEA